MATPYNILAGITSPTRYRGKLGPIFDYRSPFPPDPRAITGNNSIPPRYPPARPGPATERKVVTKTPRVGSTPMVSPTGFTGSSWQDYIKAMDDREAAVMERILRSQRAGLDSYQNALAGFGGALGTAGAESWNRVLGSYQRGAQEMGAEQGAVADQYSQSLLAGNAQIAKDFGALGQAGPADMRDASAAEAQTRTVGGTNPAGQLALVGKAWESYAPINLANQDFITKQNIAQAGREGLAAEQATRDKFAEMMLDNPDEAMKLWQGQQQIQKNDQDMRIADQGIAMAKTKADRDWWVARRNQLMQERAVTIQESALDLDRNKFDQAVIDANRQYGLDQDASKRDNRIAAANAAYQRQQINVAREAATQTGQQLDVDKSIAIGYAVDKDGNPIWKNGKTVPITAKTAGLLAGGGSSATGALSPMSQKEGINSLTRDIGRTIEENTVKVAGKNLDAAGGGAAQWVFAPKWTTGSREQNITALSQAITAQMVSQYASLGYPNINSNVIAKLVRQKVTAAFQKYGDPGRKLTGPNTVKKGPN